MPQNSINLKRLFIGSNLSNKRLNNSGAFIYYNVNKHSKKSFSALHNENCVKKKSSSLNCKPPSCKCCFGSPTCSPSGECCGAASNCCNGNASLLPCA